MTKSIEVQVSDLHIGSKFAIMHPRNAADHVPNVVQRWLFQVWEREFLPDLERILKKHKPDYVHLSELGDLGETDYKGRNREELWTLKTDDIRQNHADLIAPLHKLVDAVTFVRGTKAHVGEDGGIDEQIARDCTIAVGTGERLSDGREIMAGWYSEFTLCGVHFDVAHHGRNANKWIQISGLLSLGKEITLKRIEHGERIPDVICRGHYHKGLHTPLDMKPYVVTLPSWQLPNVFSYRIDPTVETPHVGGHVIIVEDGEILEGIRLRYTYPRKEIQCLKK